MSQGSRGCGGNSIYRVANGGCHTPSSLYDQKDQVDSIFEYLYQGLQKTRGIQGTVGADGPQGIQGLAGPDGIQGLVGGEGIQGVQGLQGAEGSTGTQGVQGLQGAEGSTGTQGVQGLQGAEGSTGTQGVQGITGSGIQGLQGLSGSVGVQGIQGIQGPGSASLTATTISYTTSSLAASDTEDFTVSLGDTALLLSVTSSTVSWVRVYGTSAARAADTRTSPGGTAPSSGSEFYAELATTVSPQTIRLAPVPVVQTTGGNAFIRVKNTDSVTQTITLNFSILVLEP